MIRGLTTATPDNLLLGVGAFYKDFVIGTDTPATASSKCRSWPIRFLSPSLLET